MERRVNVMPLVILAALIVIAGAIVAGYVGVLHAATAAERPAVVRLEPCQTEDSTGCYWDAETMGNGQGHDVVTIARVDR